MNNSSCPCGCGLSAASSSRSASPPAVASSRRGLRHVGSSVSSSSLNGHLPHSKAARYHLRRHDRSSHRSTAPCPSTLSRRPHPTRPIRSLASLPILVLLLCIFLGSAVAQMMPAATPSPSYNISTSTSSSVNQAAPIATTTTASVQMQLAASSAALNSAGNHNIDVIITQPVMCEAMNITFDPSAGTPPYTLMISIEDYWPVIVSLPATYDDATKDLWLYQWQVPTFTGPTTLPNIIVSVADSTGLMSNSSNFIQTTEPTNGATCPPFQYTADFWFYTEHPASMCQGYDVFWNGSYAPPMRALFLPESAPPIYVDSPPSDLYNMTWQMAIPGGTRFVMSMSDSKASNSNGGVSKLNIVALNEYYSDSCIVPSKQQHVLFGPTTTAPPATVFPDATSAIASLTTKAGIVATVTVIETIKKGHIVRGGGGGLSSVGFLILMVVVFVSVGLIGVAIGWFCFRRRLKKRKHNISAWDLPSNDPSVPFRADPNMPITPDVFGRGVTRQPSNAASVRGAHERTSISGASNYDPVSLSSRPLTHAPSGRASLRSWTSSAFDHFHMGASHHAGDSQPSPTDHDMALLNTAPGGLATITPSEVHGFSMGASHGRGSRDAWSPTDTIPNSAYFSDDLQSPDYAGHPDTRPGRRRSSRGNSSDGVSTKSNRVGPGPTYRPDAASQAAYQDLLASNTPPASGVERSLPFSASRGQNAASTRGNGWAEISEVVHPGSTNSTRIVRHSDAGLLLDDNDDGDELINFGTGRVMELPPQYDTIHPSTAGSHRPLLADPRTNVDSYRSRARSPGSHIQNVASVDISEARPDEVHAADLVDENDDESAFWAH